MAQSRLQGDEDKKKSSKPVDKSKIVVPGTQKKDTVDTSKLTPKQKEIYERGKYQREMRAINEDTTLTKYGKSAEAGAVNIKYKKKASPMVSVQETVDAGRKAEKEGKSSATIYKKEK